MCCRELGVEAEKSIYVGDSPSDGKAARAAGMRSIVSVKASNHVMSRIRGRHTTLSIRKARDFSRNARDACDTRAYDDAIATHSPYMERRHTRRVRGLLMALYGIPTAGCVVGRQQRGDATRLLRCARLGASQQTRMHMRMNMCVHMRMHD